MLHTRMLLGATALLAACNSQPAPVEATTPESETAQTPAATAFKIDQIADFDSPWAMTFLPDGRMLVTEKTGTLYLLAADGKTRSAVSGIPSVSSAGQGGLMDVVLHPQFATNRLVYFSYSEAKSDGTKGVVLARGTLSEGAAPSLARIQSLFRANSYGAGTGHFSGRIAFAPDGHLFFTNGDRQEFTPAQDPKVTLGKVLRLNDDGTPASGNPLAAKGFHPAVWSYGHRNLLGIAFDGAGNLWELEMGPKGGDEINLIQPGKNYGWPNASNGTHYDGRDIPDHKPGDGYEAPKIWWNPAISPGNMIVYSGSLFPQWQGDILVAGLSAKALARIDIDGTNATKAEQWSMGERIRDVKQGPDGAIWLLEDGDKDGQGRLLKLTPAG